MLFRSLPIWMGYMARALRDIPDEPRAVPDGVVSIRVNEAGQQSASGKPEYFLKEFPPPEASGGESRNTEEVRSQLY